jgi:hypothetical protein
MIDRQLFYINFVYIGTPPNINRTPAMVPLTAPRVGGLFLGGHISPKKRS